MLTAERLSAVDRAWLLMDRPTNPLTIVALVILASPIDRAALRELIAERFLPFERFRCYPASDSLGASWIPATHFDLDAHVLSVSLPPRAGQVQLEQLVGELASTPLNPSRPLWSFHLVERYQGGSALIVRIHHCYADGIALIQVLLSLAGTDVSGGAGSSLPRSAHHVANAGGLLDTALHNGLQLLSQGTGLLEKGLHYALHPVEATTVARDALGIAYEMAQLGTMADDPPTQLKNPLSGIRRVAWAAPLLLEEVKTIGRVLGCTINDVLISTLAGALGRYLEARGDPIAGVTIRATVPVNLRPDEADDADKLGNRFGLVFVDLPIGIRHPLERLYNVHAGMQTIKASVQATTTFGLLAAIGYLPAPVEPPAIALFSAKASLVASNLPGPKEPLQLAGAPISQILFWVPQAGSIGTGVSMLSYNGRVQFGVIADHEMVPDPRELIGHVGTEFERLVLLVLLGGVAL
ncbi:MAG TPA: wax ester/triacylglycerol synthase family O-acyltransferase [Steroidobacteraceae bacterium]